eukprot:Skav201842  [mRNA]  locus=scaffold484:256883:264242:- [translate_table: standard]
MANTRKGPRARPDSANAAGLKTYRHSSLQFDEPEKLEMQRPLEELHSMDQLSVVYVSHIMLRAVRNTLSRRAALRFGALRCYSAEEAAEALELVPPNAVDRYGETDAVVKLSVSGAWDHGRWTGFSCRAAAQRPTGLARSFHRSRAFRSARATKEARCHGGRVSAMAGTDVSSQWEATDADESTTDRSNPFDLAARTLAMLRSAALVGATTLASAMALFQQLKETKEQMVMGRAPDVHGERVAEVRAGQAVADQSFVETSLSLGEILEAQEAFVTGTAAADEGHVDLEVPGPVTAKLKVGADSVNRDGMMAKE